MPDLLSLCSSLFSSATGLLPNWLYAPWSSASGISRALEYFHGTIQNDIDESCTLLFYIGHCGQIHLIFILFCLLYSLFSTLIHAFSDTYANTYTHTGYPTVSILIEKLFILLKYKYNICSNLDGPKDDHTKTSKSAQRKNKHHMLSLICGI